MHKVSQGYSWVDVKFVSLGYSWVDVKYFMYFSSVAVSGTYFSGDTMYLKIIHIFSFWPILMNDS